MSSTTFSGKQKRALVCGVANQRSLGWAIAEELHRQGVAVALSYQHERFLKRVKPLAEAIGSDLLIPCDISSDNELDRLFEKISQEWGQLDTLVHATAFVDSDCLGSGLSQVSRKQFLEAMDISVYSLVAMARRSLSLMQQQGGSIITLSYYGAQKVVPDYHVMGIAKAALESAVRYLAAELGPDNIRINAISAGAVKTLSAAAVPYLQDKLDRIECESPLRRNITSQDVAALAAFLAGEGANNITGSTLFVDSGAHILGA